VGPIVSDISSAFDSYWNSPWSVPFEVFKTHLPSKKKQEKIRQKFQKNFVEMEKEFLYPLDLQKERILDTLPTLKKELVWSRAEVVSDPPDKAWKKAERGGSKSEIVNTFANLSQDTEKDLLIISPYLILSDASIDRMGEAVKKGISIRILTNSLKSTDAVPVVAMYRKTRKRILRNGIQLHEIRADAASREEYSAAQNSDARLSLHAKTVVFDRKRVFVGTFNIDPRSEYLNTEVGLLVHSSELGERLASLIESDLAPQNSYALKLRGNDVEWICEDKGGMKTYTADPLASSWLRFEAWFLGLLPIQNQL